MLAVLRTVHAWAGLALCLLVATLALSGASLAFKPQWLRTTVPHAREVAAITPAAAAQAMAAASERFGSSVRWVIFAGPEIGLHEVSTKVGGAYLTQGGDLVRQWPKNGRLVDWLFDLHHHLLSGEIGTRVAGVVGVLAATMILTGFMIWLPAARSFRGRLVPGRGRASWLSAHRDLGVIVAPVALAMSLTGAGLALDDQAAWLLHFEKPKAPPARRGQVDWLRAFEVATRPFPDARIRMAIPPAGPGKPALVRLQLASEWHANGRTFVYIDPATSSMLRIESAGAQPLGARLFNAFWPVHASKVGGLAWKTTTFLTGLSLAVLSLYGAEAYRRKLMAPRGNKVGAPSV